jgi:hypothetical protein
MARLRSPTFAGGPINDHGYFPLAISRSKTRTPSLSMRAASSRFTQGLASTLSSFWRFPFSTAKDRTFTVALTTVNAAIFA